MCKHLLIGVLLLIATFSIDAEDEIKVESENKNAVLELTDDNLEETIDVKENILVEFFAPWCGHCKSLEPEYAEAAEKLSADGITLAKVDATVNPKVAGKFDVSGYPTLMFFKNGHKYDYDGPRTSDGIVKWMKEKSSPNWKPPPSTVIDLTIDDFTKITTDSDLILVEFYAPWCDYCKKLAPEYEKASQELSKVGIKLAKVDAIKEETLKNMFKLTGYPTFKLFRKGREFEYKGPRDANGIVNYMKQEATPPTKYQNDLKQIERAFSYNKEASTVVGFFENPQQRLYVEYESAAYEMRGEQTFLHTFEKSIADHFKVKSGTVVVFKPELLQSKYENSRSEFNEPDATSTEILEFIRGNMMPLVGHRTKRNVNTLYSKKPLVVVYYDVNFSVAYRKATQMIRSEVLEVAKSYPDIVFCVSTEEEFQDELKNFGLDDSGEDVNVGFYSKDNLRYPMEPQDGFNSKKLKKFVDSVLAGSIKPYFKSQPIPAKNDGPVKVVVANNFKEMVMNNDKDVLIEFYAPWCGHCKSFEPVYVKAAKQLAKEIKTLVVAKMDAAANDVPPPFEVEGFPTIYYVPQADKEHPIVFDGTNKDVQSVVDFVRNQIAEQNQPKDEL
ncbi:Protein O-glucosyltransferase 2 [Chamberlinius hualienensis]